MANNAHLLAASAYDAADPDRARVPLTLKGAFTRYVRELEDRGEPSGERFDELWWALEAAVSHELRKRGLWTSPPSYLGIYGWERWDARPAGGGRVPGALQDLMADTYLAVFVERLPHLRAQLRNKPNIEGLVFLYLRNFLHDRQRRCDPLGFRVFNVLRCAVRAAVGAGELHVASGDPKIKNSTVLAVAADGGPFQIASADILRPIVVRWNDELLPDLVTASGARRPPLVDRLRRRLLDLEAEGVRGARFKDLIDALKDDVRLRWAALYDFEEGESAFDEDAEGFAKIVRLFPAEMRLEDVESFQKLTSCVSHLLDRQEENGRTRHYLSTLWEFLHHFASDDSAEKLPSNRKVAALLRLPRDRLPQLYAVLSELLRNCQAGLGGVLGTGDRGMAKVRPARIAAVEARDTRAMLLEATRRALRSPVDLEPPAGTPPLRRWWRRRGPAAGRWIRMAAAALLIIAGGLAATLLFHQRQTIRSLKAETAVVNPMIVILESGLGLRGEVETLRLAPEASHVILLVPLAERGGAPRYRAELLLESTGEEIWSQDELTPQPPAELRVGLPSTLLSPGGYRLRLSSLEAGLRHEIGEYRLRVEKEPPVP